MTIPELKYCGCCKMHLPVLYFSKNKAKKDGLQERCKSCRSKHHQTVKHLRKKPTKEQKRKQLIKSYSLSVKEYETLLKNQNNKCAICYSENWGRISPCIDHCHVTGKVRGLLCNTCNMALGLFKDNMEILENAKNYLKR
jgi:Recombination endonuclease VII